MSELETRIRASLNARAEDVEPTPSLWRQVQARRSRHRRRVRLTAVAATAAAVVVAIVTASLVVDGLGKQSLDVVVAPTPAETVSGQPSPTEQRPAESSPAPAAARRWVQAVDAGDSDTAWAMLGPQSREAIAGRSAFDDIMASALREGWGAWASADRLDLDATPLVQSAAEEIWVVTFSGVVSQEGGPRRSAIALAVRISDGHAFVEPFVPGPALELIGLPRNAGGEPTVPADARLPVHIDADAVAFVVAIDGQAVAPSSLERGADGAVRSVRLDPPLQAGFHTIAVGYVSASGAIALDALSFHVT